MKAINWIFKDRYTVLDVLFLILIFHFITQAMFFIAVAIAFVGAAIVIGGKKLVHRLGFDRAWQRVADRGYKVEAIKLYRQFYGVPLKEALDKVTEYMNSKR